MSENKLKKSFYITLFILFTKQVGILHIPTSIAYGAVTSLNPVHGLYSTFFPSLTYVLFSTSRHLSVGTFAILSIMVYSTITKLENKFIETASLNSTLESNITNFDEKLMDVRLRIATSLSFWCGVVQILFAVFKFGGVTKYFSQPLLRAFTTGASFHILVAQIPHVFGIYHKSKSSTSRFFKLVMVNIFFNFRWIWKQKQLRTEHKKISSFNLVGITNSIFTWLKKIS